MNQQEKSHRPLILKNDPSKKLKNIEALVAKQVIPISNLRKRNMIEQ